MDEPDTVYTVNLQVRLAGPDMDWGAVAVGLEQAVEGTVVIAGPMGTRLDVVSSTIDMAEDV